MADEVPGMIIDAVEEEETVAGENDQSTTVAAAAATPATPATPATTAQAKKKPAAKKPKKPAAAKKKKKKPSKDEDEEVVDPSLSATGGTGKRTKKKEQSFRSYIYKVLKQVHPDIAISSKAMKIMDNFIHDVFDKLTYEVTGLVKRTSKRTVGANDVQTAVKLLIPGELSKHAVSEGNKAVTKFVNQ